MTATPTLAAAAGDVLSVLDAAGLRACLIGGLAGVSTDVALPFEQEAIALATTWEPISGIRLRVCRPEHLIVYKLVAARPQDLVDVAGIV